MLDRIKRLNHEKMFTIATIVSMVVIAALLFVYLYDGDDLAYHLHRMQALIDSFKTDGLSYFPIYVYPTSLEGFGYAAPLFYCDLFFYPFAMLGALFNLPAVLCYQIMMVANIAACYFVTRYSLSLITSNKTAIAIGTFFYVVSFAVLGNISGSWIGRGFGSVFMPLAICGLYNILYKKPQSNFQFLPLALGVTGTVFSNLLDALITGFVLVVMFFVSLKYMTKRKFFIIVLSVIGTLAFCAWFIFPMIEQTVSQEFSTTMSNRQLADYTTPALGVIFPPDLLQNFFSELYNIPRIKYASQFGLSPHYFTGLIFFIILAIVCIVFRKAVFKNPLNISFFILIVLGIWFQTSLFPHTMLQKYIGIFQFPYRVQTAMTFLAVFLILEIYKVYGKKAYLYLLSIVAIFVLATFMIGTTGVEMYKSIKKGETLNEYYSNTSYISGAEYLPSVVFGTKNNPTYEQTIPQLKKKLPAANDSTAVSSAASGNTTFVNYSGAQQSTELFLPKIYYKGYAAYDQNNNLLEVNRTDTGFVSIKPITANGTIKFFYEGTAVQHYTLLISTSFSVLVVIVYIVVRIMEKKKRNKNVDV